MAGVVKRADVKEDKDGKSRGMGTVTFEQPLEAVQAICILHTCINTPESVLIYIYPTVLLSSGLFDQKVVISSP